MKLTQAKQIKQFCETLHSQPDWKEVSENISKGQQDFEIDNVRFIHTDHIRKALEDQLASDRYILGCFQSWVIAKATDWPEPLIKAAQEGEQFEAIGEAMTGEHIAELARIYAREDGYGHAFNSYDSVEEVLIIDGNMYHVFDNH